jgi:multiple sugar transport system ATP-binding protein
MANVHLEQVSKVYPGGARALAACDLGIDDGELMVLVGPSGCGKSTLLRLIAGLETPTSGVIRFDGRVVTDLRPQERNVAMVFQDYALYPYLSARGNLEFPLRMRKLARAQMRERVERVASLLGLSPLLDRLPKQLSGGQRQRVAMGRALVREPTVFLLDEPLSNLDAKLRVQVRAEIKELQERTGTTMVYVTHDQVEAMTLGHRVAVLRDGLLQQVAPPADLYERPANVFVAGFIGSPPMNLLPAVVSKGGNGHPAVRVAGSQLVLAGHELRAPLGARLTAGIRPEDLQIAPGAAKDGGLAAVVEHVENLGHESLVHLRLTGEEKPGESLLIARLGGMWQAAKGEQLQVEIDPNRIHLFGEDGAAIE